MFRRNRPQLAVLALVLAIGAAPALAGALPSAGSGSISVYVPGATNANAQPQYQGYVGFNTTGTAKLKNPRVWLACYSNGSLVYGEGGSPSTIFKLGGDSSQWVANGGGAAACTADLYYIVNANGTAEWNGKGAQGGNVYLAHTSFSATG
jgi:hypothetical protein